MNVYLVRSTEYAPEKFWQVVDLLVNFPGTMRFFHREDPVVMRDEHIREVAVDPDSWRVQKNPPVNYSPAFRGESTPAPPQSEWVVSWESLFNICRDYRSDHDIGNTEFVVLLTELSNSQNWFAAADPRNTRNIFVHTAYWDFFTGSDQRYPVAYHVVTVVLKHLMFQSYAELNKHWHMKPMGCIMDFCRNKMDISLKLRTGDICPSCLRLLEQRKVDHAVIRQVFSLMDGIRAQMLFKERFVIQRHMPELVVDGWRRKLVFPELGNLEVHLTPLEKVVYLFFLNHPEGVVIKAMPDYKSEVEKLYLGLGNQDDAEVLQSRIGDLVNPHTGSLSEKISRIRKKFSDALGNDMAADFLIQGASREPRFIAAIRAGKIRFRDEPPALPAAHQAG